jgi:hypothetical protein
MTDLQFCALYGDFFGKLQRSADSVFLGRWARELPTPLTIRLLCRTFSGIDNEAF